MAHYFFDLADGDQIIEDKLGLDFPDVPAARERATALAIDEVARRRMAREPYDARELHVRAVGGRYVAKVAFRYLSL